MDEHEVRRVGDVAQPAANDGEVASSSADKRATDGQAGDAVARRMAGANAHAAESGTTVGGEQEAGDPAAVIEAPEGTTRIDPTVKLTAPILAAFEVLRPYLPANARMTSGLRTDEDQIRVINEYYRAHGGPPKVVDPEQRRRWLARRGLQIAAVGTSPHRTGLAFDLGGGGIDAMQRAVRRCHAEKPKEFLLKGTIVERANNCLHVDLTG